MKKKKAKLKVKNIIFLIVGLVVVIFLCMFFFRNRDFQVEIKNKVLNVGEEYKDNFRATFKGKDVTDEVSVTNNVFNEKVGKYQVTFIYKTDKREYKVVKTIEIKDTEKPEIVLTKGNEITVTLNSEYQDPGYKATDNYDGDLTSKVKVSGSVDTSKEGEYEITYAVSDSSKNEATVVRKVTVTAISPLTMSVKEFSLEGLFTDVMLKKTSDKGSAYSDDFVIAGDSIALYYVMNKQIPGTRLWHKEGINPETALTSSIYINHIDTGKTFVENFKEKKPKKVLLTMGTNSASYMEPAYFIKNYKKLIQEMLKASPDTLLIVQSIPPVDASFDRSDKAAEKINNDKINKLNYYILEMCSELHVPFLNSAESLKDENGAMKAEYSREDGIHPSQAGNAQMMKYFETHVYEK